MGGKQFGNLLCLARARGGDSDPDLGPSRQRVPMVQPP